MPRIPNKIIINDFGIKSFLLIIKGYLLGILAVLKGSKNIGWEIEDGGFGGEPEAMKFLAEQQIWCANVDDACKDFIAALAEAHAAQMQRNDTMRLWVDKMRAQKQQQP